MTITETETVVWEEPPAKVGKHSVFFQTLRENPGRSAVWRGVSVSVPSQIKNGGYAGIEKGEFEAVSRNMHEVDGKSRCDVYIRFVPVADRAVANDETPDTPEAVEPTEPTFD